MSLFFCASIQHFGLAVWHINKFGNLVALALGTYHIWSIFCSLYAFFFRGILRTHTWLSGGTRVLNVAMEILTAFLASGYDAIMGIREYHIRFM
jgi:hypothetical protein